MTTDPRRKIVMICKIEADSWDALDGRLACLRQEIAETGSLSKQSISGGYSSNHIFVTSVDEEITHDKWASNLNKYLDEITSSEKAE